RRRHTRFSRDWSSDVCSSDLGAAEIDRKRFEYIAGCNAEHLGLVAVNISVHARRSGIEKRIDPGEPFLLVCLSDDRVGDLLHLSIALAVAVLEHHAKAASGTDALN